MKTKFMQLILIFIAFIYSMNVFGQISVTTGFVGNTFNGADNKWVQNYATEADVASDGTLVTASDWDEDGRCVGIWKDGQPVALIKGLGGNCWGWGTATEAVAIDNNYLYVNNCDGDLLRFNRSNGYLFVDKYATGVAEGMTCSGGNVYLIKSNGDVQKRSASSLGSVSLSFNVPGGYDLAVDESGNIWVLTTNKEVLKYNSSGAYTSTKIAAQSGWVPASVNYDAYNNLLMVADNGPRRQVIKFNTSGTQVGTFGDIGGISAGDKGVVGDLRFWNIAGAGTDANNNIYVALNENAVSLRKFNSSGVKQWEVLGMMFSDIASIDPASDGTEIYGINEHMQFNYSTQQWSIKSLTIDQIAYPTDPRNKVTGTDITSALMRRINGNLIMFATGMYADKWHIYRFDGEIAVHCLTKSNLGWATLPDKNGNIWYEKDGKILKIPCTGISGGCPVYGSEVTVAASRPSPFNAIERLLYDVDNDVMYISGYTPSAPSISWGLIGSTLCKYPNWSTGNRTASNTLILPKDVEGFHPKAITVAGDYVFVVTSRDRGKTFIYNTSNLSSVGYIPAPTNLGNIGWIDMPYAVQAFKRSNGSYSILVEDNARGKNLLYQWCPTGNCEGECTTSVDSVIISSKTLELNGYQSDTLTASVFPDTVCYNQVNWKSTNDSIVTVNSKGVVTSASVGSAWIKAVSEQQSDVMDSCMIIVNHVAVTDIICDPDSAILPISYKLEIDVQFLPQNAINRKVTWESSDMAIASVDSNGIVVGNGEGACYITARSVEGGFSDSCYLEVIPIPVQSIHFDQKKVALWLNDSLQMSVELTPNDANNKAIIWEILDENIASVNTDGLVIGENIGETKLIAISVDGGYSDTCSVKVLEDNMLANADIGSVCTKGSYNVISDSLYTLTAGGADIWGEKDGFHFAYKKASNDMLILARLNSLTNTNEWAKAGVMIRESIDPGSKHAMMVLIPSNRTSFQRRTETDGASEDNTTGNGIQTPCWVKMVREGNKFTGYYSLYGIEWNEVGSVTMEMNSDFYIGLCLTSHEDCVEGVAEFDNLVITNNLDTILDLPNIAPFVNIISPVNNANYFINDEVNISAIANDVDGSITKVEFYTNSELIGTAHTSPYIISYVYNTVGEQSIEVWAYDIEDEIAISDAVKINILTLVSVNDLLSDNNIKMYPNPVSKNLNFTVTSAKVKKLDIRVFDLTGSTRNSYLIDVNGGKNNFSIDVGNLEEGLYIIEVGQQRFKIVVQK